MWEGSYGREPFDLRLTALRLIACFPVILVVTLAGTLMFGGGYYVKNVLLQGEKQYSVTSVYRVDYVVEETKDIGVVYINEMSWNTYLHSQEFLDAVMKHLKELSSSMDSAWPDSITSQEVSDSLTAYLASDLRVPSTAIVTNFPEKSLLIARAVELAMTEEFPGGIEEISDIRVIDAPREASVVIPDVRPLRAFVLSAVLSCFFAVILFLLKETGDDNIWLPATIWKRYGVKTAGTLESDCLAENLRYFYEGKRKVAVCSVQEDLDPAEILAALRKKSQTEDWFAVPSPVLCPESCRALREADGILLAAGAGAHAGKQLEYCLEYLRQQDCDVTSVILCNADERLIKAYYFLGKPEQQSRAGLR